MVSGVFRERDLIPLCLWVRRFQETPQRRALFPSTSPPWPRKTYRASRMGSTGVRPQMSAGKARPASQYTATVRRHPVSSSVDVDLWQQDVGVL